MKTGDRGDWGGGKNCFDSTLGERAYKAFIYGPDYLEPETY